MCALYMCGKHRWRFFQYKNPISKQNGHNDILKIYHLTAMTRVNLLFCHKKLTVVRNGGLTALLIAFDMALTGNKSGPKKIDLMTIWPHWWYEQKARVYCIWHRRVARGRFLGEVNCWFSISAEQWISPSLPNGETPDESFRKLLINAWNICLI